MRDWIRERKNMGIIFTAYKNLVVKGKRKPGEGIFSSTVEQEVVHMGRGDAWAIGSEKDEFGRKRAIGDLLGGHTPPPVFVFGLRLNLTY